MAPTPSRQLLSNGFAPWSLLVALTVMLTSPSQAFVLQLPAATSIIGRSSSTSSSGTICCSTQWVYHRFGSSTSTAAAAAQGVAVGVSGEFWSLRGRRGQRASTVTSMTASSHRHHQSSSSAPIIGATAGKAAPPPPAKTVMGALTNQGIPRKRRRRPMIGAAVWAEFKEEQKGVTRILHGLPEEEGPGAAIDTVVPGDDEGAPRQRRPARRPTLGEFMAETRSRSPDVEAMVPIMKAVGKTCTAVSRLVRRAQIDGMAGLHQESVGTDGGGGGAESVNVQGEVQKELDVLSNSIFLTGFCQPHSMSCVASEEEETPRMCAAVVGEEMHGGEYAAVFDPLDGSANIEAGLPCGTIFGILRTSGSAREGRKAGPGTIVLPGRRLVAAGYCLYGPSTKLVFTLGSGVFEFTLEGEGVAEQEARERRRETGNSDSGGSGSGSGLGGGDLNFVLSRSNMRIPQSGKVYSVNEANSPSWSEAIQDYFRDLKTSMVNDDPSLQTAPGDVENQYAGALVADIHNILVHGGVFAYPADVYNPNGKLRLLYEGNPMAMIIEEAGGVATTGFERIMDVRPQSVHHRIPAFFGSPENLLPLLNPRYLDSKKR